LSLIHSHLTFNRYRPKVKAMQEVDDPIERSKNYIVGYPIIYEHINML